MKRRTAAQHQMQLTDFDVMPVILPPIPFPSGATRKRVVIDRPTPPPVIRTCPTCGATFQDYTKRANTKYCRSYCRVKMSETKRDTAIATLADDMGTTAFLVYELYYDFGGLMQVELMLKERGYHWNIDKKAWSK